MYNFESDSFQFINYVDLTESQHRLVHAARNHPDIRKWMTNSAEFSFESHMNFVEKLKTSQTQIMWGVFRFDEFVGSVNISNYDREKKSAEIGNFVAPNFLGSGIGSEFLYLICRYLMSEMKMENIFSKILLTNKGTLAMSKKLQTVEYRNDLEYSFRVLTSGTWSQIPVTLEEFKKSLYRKKH